MVWKEQKRRSCRIPTYAFYCHSSGASVENHKHLTDKQNTRPRWPTYKSRT